MRRAVGGSLFVLFMACSPFEEATQRGDAGPDDAKNSVDGDLGPPLGVASCAYVRCDAAFTLTCTAENCDDQSFDWHSFGNINTSSSECRIAATSGEAIRLQESMRVADTDAVVFGMALAAPLPVAADATLMRMFGEAGRGEIEIEVGPSSARACYVAPGGKRTCTGGFGLEAKQLVVYVSLRKAVVEIYAGCSAAVERLALPAPFVRPGESITAEGGCMVRGGACNVAIDQVVLGHFPP